MNVWQIKVTVAVGLVVLLGTKAVAEETHYGTRIPTTQELIDVLSPNSLPDLGKSRGIVINPVEASKPELTQQTTSVEPTSESTNSGSASMRILFQFDSAALTPAAIEQLHPLGKALQSSELAGMRFTLEGHTDAVGSAVYNQSLSERRAKVIKDHLVKNYQVSTEDIQTVGLGESNLLMPDAPDHAENRRVRIVTIQ